MEIEKNVFEKDNNFEYHIECSSMRIFNYMIHGKSTQT